MGVWGDYNDHCRNLYFCEQHSLTITFPFILQRKEKEIDNWNWKIPTKKPGKLGPVCVWHGVRVWGTQSKLIQDGSNVRLHMQICRSPPKFLVIRFVVCVLMGFAMSVLHCVDRRFRQNIKASVVQSGIRGKFNLTLKTTSQIRSRKKRLWTKRRNRKRDFEETEPRFKVNLGRVFVSLPSTKNRSRRTNNSWLKWTFIYFASVFYHDLICLKRGVWNFFFYRRGKKVCKKVCKRLVWAFCGNF